MPKENAEGEAGAEAKERQRQAKGKPIVGSLEIEKVLRSFVIISNFSFAPQYILWLNDKTGS